MKMSKVGKFLIGKTFDVSSGLTFLNIAFRVVLFLGEGALVIGLSYNNLSWVFCCSTAATSEMLEISSIKYAKAGNRNQHFKIYIYKFKRVTGLLLGVRPYVALWSATSRFIYLLWGRVTLST